MPDNYAEAWRKAGRDPDAQIPEGFQCSYADPGERACPAWRCDCFVDQYPDDPFGLHPEAFVVGSPEENGG